MTNFRNTAVPQIFIIYVSIEYSDLVSIIYGFIRYNDVVLSNKII